MRLKALSCDPLDDGWNEPADVFSRLMTDRRPVSASAAGDTVLYRADGKLTPAVLVEPAGEGCWLARDARHTNGLIYLGAESITARLPRMDLLEEAA